RPSPEQQQAAEGERVGAQHPLQPLLGEADVRLDRGQRHEHDRGVEQHHEEGAAEERKRPPPAGIGCIQHVAAASWCGRDQRVVARLHESSWVVVLDSCQRVVTVTCVDAPSHRPNGRPSGGGRSTIEVMLYGRDPERSIIGGLLEGAGASGSGVLVIRGEAGVGKSALLEDARERGSDMRVLACAGVEAESALPFAGLHQLLRPVLRHLDKVPPPQADALRGALGLAAARGEDRFLVSLAVLSLLAEAAEQRPLLCLVDDAHWLDDASADALVFVARRLEAEGIVLLFASREGEAREFDAPELAELRLAGLDADAAAALLDRHAGVGLSPGTRARGGGGGG